MTTTLPDGTAKTSTEWYDKELKIVIREELPGGYVREMRDIVVGPQDPGLYLVPQGYQQVAAPEATGSATPGTALR